MIVIQENRTLDNLFNGFPGANTVTAGLDSQGTSIPLKVVPLDDRSVVGHELTDYLAAYDGGKMDGFDLETGGLLRLRTHQARRRAAVLGHGPAIRARG